MIVSKLNQDYKPVIYVVISGAYLLYSEYVFKRANPMEGMPASPSGRDMSKMKM